MQLTVTGVPSLVTVSLWAPAVAVSIGLPEATGAVQTMCWPLADPDTHDQEASTTCPTV